MISNTLCWCWSVWTEQKLTGHICNEEPIHGVHPVRIATRRSFPIWRRSGYGSEYISLNIYHAGCWKYGLLSRPQLLIWILLIGAQLSSESLYLEISQSVIIIILTIPIITMIRNFFISRCKLTNWQSYSGSLIFCISLPVEETNISGNITQTYYFLRLGVGTAKSALLFFLQHTDPSHYHNRQSTAEICWFTRYGCLRFDQHENIKHKYLANLSEAFLC